MDLPGNLGRTRRLRWWCVMRLRPWPEARTAAAHALRAGRIARDSMPARDAAEAAHTPGGPSVADLEALIRRHRAEAAQHTRPRAAA